MSYYDAYYMDGKRQHSDYFDSRPEPLVIPQMWTIPEFGNEKFIFDHNVMLTPSPSPHSSLLTSPSAGATPDFEYYAPDFPVEYNSQAFKCHCGRNFDTLKKFETHAKSHRQQDKPHICDQCQVTPFNNREVSLASKT